MHVLLLDDEADMRSMIEEVLRMSGCTVSSFSTGDEALAFLTAPTTSMSS
jgi:CheY-like chemotaxis protein